MRLPSRRLISARFNMTPMIDVTFLLIIFFVLSSRLAERESLEVELPSASTGRPATSDDRPRLSVTVSADGRLVIGSTPVTSAELSDQLRVQRDRHGQDLEVRIRADRGVPYGAVEPILLASADAGIWNVTFAVAEEVESRQSTVENQNR